MKEHRIVVFGGSSLYRLPIYNQMAKELGCDYHIFEDSAASGIKSYQYKELKNFKCVVRPRYLLGNFYWQNDTLNLIHSRYDLIIVGGPYCIAYWPLMIYRRLIGKKVASWSHGMYGRETGVRKLIKSWFYKLCDMNFVYNDRAIDLMVKCGIKRERIIKVGNSLDTDRNLQIRKRLSKSDILSAHFGNLNPILIFVGRITKEKKLHMILQAMNILRNEGINLNFVVVGKDVDGVNLERKASEIGLDSQLFMYGPCYDDEVLGNFFYNSDVCVSPGNVGLTAINAMSFGCPVISHNNYNYQGPEYSAICPDKTGDFFEQGNLESLSAVIKKWTSYEYISRRDEFEKNCFKEVDKNWTIYSETKAFKRGISRIIDIDSDDCTRKL